MSKIPKPNFTQAPNVLFDSMMREMGDAELRVVLAVVRQTMGYHRERCRMSLSAIMTMTGLSRQGAINGIAAAMKRGVVDREMVGKTERDGFTYGLVVNDVDHELVNDVDQDDAGVVNEVDQGLVNDVDYIKRKSLKKERRSSSAADAAPASSSQTSKARRGGKRDLHFEALAEMCGLQTNRLSPGNRIQLGKHAASLAGDGVSPEFIRACGSSWYTKKFGWKDRAEVKPPSPAQAAEWVGQEVEAKKRGRVPDGAKIIDGKTVFWSPDASKADIVWKI